MKEKLRTFYKKVYKDKKFVAAVAVFGLIVAFCIGHSLSFGSHRGPIGQPGRDGRFAQGQMQNGLGQGQQFQGRRGQIPQGQDGQPQIPSQGGVDGTTGATAKQN